MSNTTILKFDSNTEVTFYKAKNGAYYLNATPIAKQFKKQTTRFCNSKGTKEYIEALKKLEGNDEEEYIKIFDSGDYKGTWIHKKLMILFARYLNPDFAVWCDTQLEALLSGNKNKELYAPKEENLQDTLVLLHSYTATPLVQEWVTDRTDDGSVRFDMVNVCDSMVIELKKETITLDNIIEKVVMKSYMKHIDSEFGEGRYKLIFVSPEGITKEALTLINLLDNVYFYDWDKYIKDLMKKIEHKCGKEYWYFNQIQPKLIAMLNKK